MKLFKKLRDHGRSSEIPTTSSTSAPPPLSPSCASDHRAAASGAVAQTNPSPPSPSDASRPSPAGDFMLSEEEYQVQLALAISDSEFRDDPDGDQIRAAKLLSLGKQRMDPIREDDASADALSRRYWEYDVLDYNDKVLDGFYDVLGLSTSSSDGKMPSLVALQNGNLGFESIVVNHPIDHDLVELEQVAQCILLDCPVAEVGVLVQRISELVAGHMGGPVKDASIMLARWSENSTELRTSLQTSVLPIGCVKLGLSRHRALLFKVLADKVGVPCKLVKGSHYTGVDDNALNIIKLDSGREFLVDLMADPGTLIPAEVLSAKDAPLSSGNSRLAENLNSWAKNKLGGDLSRTEQFYGIGSGASSFGNNVLDKRSWYEKAVLVPSVPSSGTSSITVGSSSSVNAEALSLFDQPNQCSFKQKGIAEAPPNVSTSTSEKLIIVPNSQDAEDSRNLFAELNPFQEVGVRKTSGPPKITTDNNKTEYHRRRESIVSGPGRPQHPLIWKNRPACNEVPNTKQYKIVEGILPRKDIGVNDLIASSSNQSSGDGKALFDGPCGTGVLVSTGLGGIHQDGKMHIGHTTAQANKQLNQPSERKNRNENSMALQTTGEVNERVNDIEKHDWKKYSDDSFMVTDVIAKNPETSTSPSEVRLSRLDPMLDDVAEPEIPWEHLIIGERIGLGSYGEVYRADWNGTEVAVKKFLDQDFDGDALDEFRREVKIMRRLRHPNVVLFMGAVTRPPNLSIVSEFLPRGSLYRILHRPNCQIEEKRRIKMALDVAKGMNCLHASAPTIVHRDLKSPNLLVDKNWTVKVCDFGLSRLKHSTFLSSKSTAGTPEWMAPEVLRNEPSNEKCDVYSYGVILWELATLRMPWSGMNPMQVVGAVGFQDRRLEIPKEVDPLVARIIWQCWQTDPNLRPSFAELTTALKSLQRLVIPSHQDAQNPPLPQEIPVNSTP
ncbi:hypothetical protein J5N97_009938 [Dioscorea zingiberensis]|uniref:non-specific serine/threonine protein kinase n=1 Tax=Dioscorea zingiberensis TaxID=325984 RepID=A0A9D5D0D0_9LILI|nr:hypothetical protein J5N97_009938 [Dioscorea zingiberensis]